MKWPCIEWCQRKNKMVNGFVEMTSCWIIPSQHTYTRRSWQDYQWSTYNKIPRVCAFQVFSVYFIYSILYYKYLDRTDWLEVLEHLHCHLVELLILSFSCLDQLLHAFYSYTWFSHPCCSIHLSSCSHFSHSQCSHLCSSCSHCCTLGLSTSSSCY